MDEPVRTTFAGIDVSAKTLQLAIQRQGGFDEAVFDNDAKGHVKLARYLTKRAPAAKVCIEATGPYSGPICSVLNAKDFHVVLANPRATKSFAKARMQRAKTDIVDSRLLAAFAETIPAPRWQPRPPAHEELVSLVRHLDFVVRGVAREKAALHSATVGEPAALWVVESLEEAITAGESRIAGIEKHAAQCVRQDPTLREHFDRLVALPGVGDRAALYLLGYFVALPGELTADQVVAHAGLDPRPRESGRCAPISRPISRSGDGRVRRLMYMCAMASVRTEGSPFGRVYDRLVARGKPKKLALIAIARRLLVVLWTVFRTGDAYDPTRVGCQSPP